MKKPENTVQSDTPSTPHESFNYKITQFFLHNTRLTALALLLVILVGIFSLFNLKTTGFPSPSVGIAVVQTVYPGAASEVVLRDVTQPLEKAIGGIEGVKSYTSNTKNSVSIIQISIDEKANIDGVKSKISTEVASVVLPAAAQKPVTIGVNIGGPDYIFSITAPTIAQTFDVADTLKTEILALTSTKSVTEQNELAKKAIITVDPQKLASSGITLEAITAKIQTLDESLPVVSGVALDNQSQSITTSIRGKSLADLAALTITPRVVQIPSLTDSAPPAPIRLSDIATISVGYRFENAGLPSLVGTQVGGTIATQNAVVFNISSNDGTDQIKYISEIEAIIAKQNVVFAKATDAIASTEKPIVIEHYSVNESNQEQVNEVVKGLIGGKLSSDNPLVANMGWILGALQLVVLVMIAFVSWRAAVVAAISIPLSLIFSLGYVYLIGENLNTLVLFSLVLVIGLVVDPALVILEAVQRKIDTGMKPIPAVLAAIHDVGDGLFLATLISAIVFIPFGVISGILGQIFKYIPLTVIPAIIGSYIVPLVFLSWIGSLLLKKTKGKTENEQENLWGIAKWLVAFNRKILHSPVWVRSVVVILGLAIPIGVSAYFFGSRQITQVTFSSSENGELLEAVGTFHSDLTDEAKNKVSSEIITTLMQNKDVVSVYPLGKESNFAYYARLKPIKERSQTGKKVAAQLTNDISPTLKAAFNDFSVSNISQGPPGQNYQVAISVKENDLTTLKQGALGVSAVLKKLCIKDKKVLIGPESDCTPIVEKVDDGYTGKENKVIDIALSRQLLEEKSLVLANGPQTAIVNQQVRNAFEIGTKTTKYGNVVVDGKNIDITLEKSTPAPSTLSALTDLTVTGITGQQVPLSSIAQFETKTPSSSIARTKGQTIGVVQAQLKTGYTDQQISAQVTQVVVDYFAKDSAKESKALGLQQNSVTSFSEGGSAGFVKSFGDLVLALVLAIILVYTLLVVFFDSFSLPLVILYTIPLTLLGWVPALALFGGGQFGFLEIIGLIILVGLVCNVAIYLIDAARQKIAHGVDEKEAIALASGLRLRPVLLTKLVAAASLAPLILFAEIYRSLSIVVVFGLFASGFASLITTPILFVFFRWLSREYRLLAWYHKLLFFPLMIPYIGVMGYLSKKRQEK
jgi:hydrophobic/amphiphilic exporter-1 (mainly G- bacteria), HAE1 family